ncbi:MAG: DUF86 domain-containing protein [Magnetospirillum sp. WYHS-4]
MAFRSLKARLIDIADAIEAVEGHLRLVPLDGFETNPTVYRAIERELEIVSEASRHIPNERKGRYPNIAWRKVADLGNELRHAYHRVDPGLLKEIVREHLPVLGTAVREMLAGED